MRRRRVLRVGLVLAVWAPIFVIAGGFARGTSSADFSGFDLGANATAVEFSFDSPSLGIPAHPTGELDLAHSETTLRSGPAAYGLGSIAWPGQVAAALPSFLQSEVESNCKCKLPAAVPNYPVRAESFYPQGPSTASLDAGTMHMSSTAKEKDAEGTAYVNKFSVPFVGSMGNQSSLSSSGFDPDGAVSMAEASANDVSLINGLITIDSVVTRTSAHSDGEKGTVAGTTTVAGAEVNGIGKVIIDTTGVHVAGQSASTTAQQQALNQVLNQAGVTMQLSAPVDTIAGPKASRALGGLLISIKSSTIAPLVAALPAQLRDQIQSQVTFDQIVYVQIAPAVVSANAAKAFVFQPGVPPVAGGLNPSGNSSGAGGTTTVGGVGLSQAASGGLAPATTTGGGTSVALAPVRTTFHGVPVWLVVLLVLLALASSRPLTMLADRVFATRAGEARCPDEER